MRKVIIIGSSNKNGNTKEVVGNLCLLSDFDVIDLNDFSVGYYDYEHKNKNDDYLTLIENIILNYDIFIFATPVYWYAMSGIMKVFFDRLTDLLDEEVELGRKLRNKNMAVLSSSIGNNLEEKFWFPFIETAKYLGINYLGNVHTIVDKDNTEALKEIIEAINITSSKSEFIIQN